MTVDFASYAEEKGIKYFMISFTDLFGGQRAKLVPAQAIAPAVATLVSAAPAPFALAESVARPNPSPAPAFDPAALSESDSPSPDGLPTAMAEHLGEAMARFFPN